MKHLQPFKLFEAKESKDKSFTPREEMIKLLHQKFPNVIARTERFKKDDVNGIWSGAESSSFIDDAKKIDAFNPSGAYSYNPRLDKDYVLEVHKKLAKFLEDNGWYTEFYDDATPIFYPIHNTNESVHHATYYCFAIKKDYSIVDHKCDNDLAADAYEDQTTRYNSKTDGEYLYSACTTDTRWKSMAENVVKKLKAGIPAKDIDVYESESVDEGKTTYKGFSIKTHRTVTKTGSEPGWFADTTRKGGESLGEVGPVHTEQEAIKLSKKEIDNLKENLSEELTQDAKDFIAKKIKFLIGEGRPQKQAVAMAYQYAKKEGYKIPDND